MTIETIREAQERINALHAIVTDRMPRSFELTFEIGANEQPCIQLYSSAPSKLREGEEGSIMEWFKGDDFGEAEGKLLEWYYERPTLEEAAKQKALRKVALAVEACREANLEGEQWAADIQALMERLSKNIIEDKTPKDEDFLF